MSRASVSGLLQASGNGTICGGQTELPSQHRQSTSDDADCIFKQVFFLQSQF